MNRFGPPIAPIEPSARALARNERVLRSIGWLARQGLRRWFERVEVHGAEHLVGGPRLLLTNHCHVLDPALLSAYANRSVQFLVTESALFDSPTARFLAWSGQVPKRKLESDTRAIRLLRQWCGLGAAVCMFPEGRFAWDGGPQPLQPGLLHLVHHLDAPVVTVRQLNGDRVWPVWARHARRTTVRLEIDPPQRFAPGQDIEHYVRERLRVDPATCPRWPAHGRNLAAGLAQVLRFCPNCGTEGALDDARDTLGCRACGAGWDVGGDNVLRRASQSLTVGEAIATVRAILLEGWTAGPALRSRGDVELFDARAAVWEPIAEGPLELRDGVLRLGRWELPVATLLGYTLDWGDVMLLRTPRSRVALRMKHDSRALWEHALETARQRAIPEPAPSRDGRAR